MPGMFIEMVGIFTGNLVVGRAGEALRINKVSHCLSAVDVGHKISELQYTIADQGFDRGEVRKKYSNGSHLR